MALAKCRHIATETLFIREPVPERFPSFPVSHCFDRRHSEFLILDF